MNNISEIKVVFKPKRANKPKITSPEDAYNIILPYFSDVDFRESFKLIVLSKNNRVLGYYTVSIGGLSSTVVDIRHIIAVALKSNANSIIIAHNHPSGELAPPKSDIAITEKISKACDIFDIKLLDHIIITSDSYYSLADNGKM